MVVYVVMGNDFPEAVFSCAKEAENFCERRKEDARDKYGGLRINWRFYEFELDCQKGS